MFKATSLQNHRMDNAKFTGLAAANLFTHEGHQRNTVKSRVFNWVLSETMCGKNKPCTSFAGTHDVRIEPKKSTHPTMFMEEIWQTTWDLYNKQAL